MKHAAAALILAGLALARPAAAHDSSFTYGALREVDGGRRIEYQLKIRSTDLFEALGGATGDDPTEREIRAGEAALYDYVAARVTLSAVGQTCRVERAPLAIEAAGDRFAVLGFALVCPAPIAVAELDYALFYDLDAGHIGLVRVDDETVQLRAPDDSRLVWRVGERPDGDLLGFLGSGVHHILLGLDHILFLVSLLLVAVLRPSARGLEARPPRAATRYTVGVVTAFTCAHSVTLIAAALGWVSLPGRLVESVIAASILYVAIENVARPAPPRRFLVTFGFGLVHGLGFAAMLAPALPDDAVVLPLLAFNLGVELGQLAIVALLLPALLAAGRRLGPDRYRRLVVGGGAVACGGLAAVWLLERAFEVSILGM